jgi:hypothetical protein
MGVMARTARNNEVVRGVGSGELIAPRNGACGDGDKSDVQSMVDRRGQLCG